MTIEFESAELRPELGILLYGAEGVGKSTAAASAPGPVVYINVDRPGGIQFARRHRPDQEIRELRADGRKKLEDAYLYLRDGGDGARSVVVDSLGRLYDVILADIAKDDRHPTLPERGDTNTWIERYVLALLELPVNVVLVAHDNPVKVGGNDEDGTATHELFPFTGTNNATLAKKLMRALDVVGYCGRVEPQGDDEEVRFVAQLFTGGNRRGKDSTDVIGPVADLDLAAWVERNRAAQAAAINPKEQT